MHRKLPIALLTLLLLATVIGGFVYSALLPTTSYASARRPSHFQFTPTNPYPTPVCTETGLSGPGQQENLLYCAGGQNIAPSTYPEAISLAQQKHYIVGTPLFVTETIDWANCQVTYVEFSSGFHAEHHNVNSACAPDLTVRYYTPTGVLVWP